MKGDARDKPDYTDHRKRLRKRFIGGGIRNLQDYELLELLLTYSIAQKDTKPAGKALLRRFKDIPGVLNAEMHELQNIKGIGESSAVLIKLTRSLLELYLKENELMRKKLSSSDTVVDYCRVSMGGLKDEQFRALYLNSQNELLAEEVIYEGTVDHAVVYPRKVLELALRHKASGIILVHNHPGGLLKPSKYDIELTRRLNGTAAEMGVRINDHFIITVEGYFSFYENGLL